MAQNKIIYIVLAVIILAAILLWWQFYRTPAEETEVPAGRSEGLGAEIYSETGAGAASDIPTVNPTANPLGGVYKNPFE